MGDWSRSESERYQDLKAQAQQTLRHGRSTTTKTLEVEANHARAKSTDPDVPERERKVWKQLADDLDTRLGRNAPPSKQEELF